MKRLTVFLLLVFSFSSLAQQPVEPPAQSAAEPRISVIAAPPPTAKRPVVDEYQDVKVVDDYRWLENNNEEVRTWVEAQNTRTRAYLDSLPDRPKIYDWLQQLEKRQSATHYGLQAAGGLLFALKWQPGKQQPMLVTLKSPDDPASEHVVLDPTSVDPSGHTAIQFYVPSLDGKQVAVCLAEGGSEAGNVHVYDVATGKAQPDVVPRVNFPTAGGSVAWNADASGFYYTRYPHQGERPLQDLNFYQQIYFHKLGTPADQDSYVLGKNFPRIAEISLSTSDDGKHLLAIVANGDGGEYEHFLLGPEGKWKQLTQFADQISAAAFGADDELYLVSRDGAPRGKMLRLSLATPDLKKATVVVPESEAVIQGFGFALSGFPANFAATRDRLYVVDVIGGPTQIRVFDHAGKPLGLVPIEPVSAVSQVLRLDNGELLFRDSSYVKPGAWYVFDPQQNKTTVTALRSTSPVDFGDIEAVRELAVSKDGTKVPVNIIRKKGIQLDGSHPTLLTGYGGFGISMTPGFDPSLRMWLDAGGVYAIANLRGGAEFGEEWHKAGMLTNKQHVFDDFIACAEHLIQAKYTNPKKLGIEGGSNGGLLMGAVLTQRPDLFRAVVSVAGLYDMLRFQTTQNGQFNVTEYGSVRDPEQFRALYAYSPYQHVKDGTKYPAILLTVGENDLRVDPWHSRKFAARLQAATASGKPVLLLSFSDAGHGGIGAGEDQQIAMETFNWAFLFDQLGVRFDSPPLNH
jgi:prolyl oligopeptidase